jgi:oligoendopeptidase F
VTEAEDFLKVNGWHSAYRSVDVSLQYLEKSKSKSAATRNSFLNILKNFCKHNKVLPDEIIKQSKKKIQQEVESYLSSLKKRKRSEDERVGSTKNTYWTILHIFFRENNRSDIVIKREHQSSRPKLNVIKLNLGDAWKIIV